MTALIARQIFKKWKAQLTDKDRSSKSVRTNFEELWYDFWCASIAPDVAEGFVSQAVAAHMPNTFIAKKTYNIHKNTLFGMTYDEWIKNWKEDISNKCEASYYERYPLEDIPNNPPPVTEKKEFGGMSAEEYKRQRRYISQFPLLDLKAKRKQMEELEKNLELEEIRLEELLNDETK